MRQLAISSDLRDPDGQVELGYTVRDLARIAGVQPSTVAEWGRAGWLTQPTPEPSHGRRGRTQYRYPPPADGAARSLKRLRRRVTNVAEIGMWLWLEGYDHIRPDLGRLEQSLQQAHSALWCDLRSSIPSLPVEGRRSLTPLEREAVLDEVDRHYIKRWYDELPEHQAKALSIVLLALLGLVRPDDLTAWEESIARERSRGYYEHGYFDAVLISFAEWAGAKTSEFLEHLDTRDVAQSGHFFAAMALPSSIELDWPGMRAIWQTLCQLTDGVLDDTPTLPLDPFAKLGAYLRISMYKLGLIPTLYLLSFLVRSSPRSADA